MKYIEKLLQGAEVEWKKLGEVCKIKNGKSYKHLNDGDIPVYGSGGIMKHVDEAAYDSPSVLIPRKGSLKNLFYVETPFWNVDTIFYTEIDVNQILPKYLYYFLATQKLEELNLAGGVPSLTQTILNRLPIPIPPLHVQQEIVRILDKFTELEAKLETELELRKQQYERYRDQLLSPDDPGRRGINTMIELGEIGEVRMCKRILKRQTSAVGDIPFYKIGTFGKTADAYIPRELFEKYKAKYNYPNKGEILISASGTIGRSVIFDGKESYFQDSNIVWIENNERFVLNKYLFYCYQTIQWNVVDGGTLDRLYNDYLRKTLIPVPYRNDVEKSLAEQQRIVSLLDKFHTLTTSISEGLPRELELRKQQYAYYRDQLLAFER